MSIKIYGRLKMRDMDCFRETTNRMDPFAVAVRKEGIGVVGHVPKKISTACSIFIRRNGAIICQVTGGRQYSQDLPQGGLEIPCVLRFSGVDAEVDKLKRLLKKEESKNEASTTVNESEGVTPDFDDSNSVRPNKRRRLDFEDPSTVWVKYGNITLTIRDKLTISNGEELDDNHINFAQGLISKQFPDFTGFECTLIEHCMFEWKDNYIQIFHVRGNHWITVTTVGSSHGEIAVMDSLHKSMDDSTNKKLCHILNLSSIKYNFPCNQVQKGIKDCGVFAIAYAVHIARNGVIDDLPFLNQSKLCPLLINYLQMLHIDTFA